MFIKNNISDNLSDNLSDNTLKTLDSNDENIFVVKETIEPEVLDVIECIKSKLDKDKPRLLSNKNLVLKNKKVFEDDRNIYSNISIIDDKFLPSTELSLVEAIINIKKNPACIPFNLYVERWKQVKLKDNITKKIKKVELPQKLDDSLLPPFNLPLTLAIHKIKSNPKCVPFELYVKRWNECKVKMKHTNNIK
jgi:hypothetical protein